ncbi:hypothetical protein [Endozoicomonas sp. SCSIO W0465]|uniref:hypothetical protein n=1 Tax=Endozoicomonas sp. SCSIO W0465 TaxID=2918516 RepID=UPI0020755EDF|nr:hypothetical protein [Endozoicomonas sp. SCSIO W0465]USE34431.1 hypothetical protein MJO57_20070 [Endozoicomonas sp. SCSIO W0465]
MESLHQSVPRCIPLTRCKKNFGLQLGPQCKVYALAVVHHVLCACGQLLPYKKGDRNALSARKIAKFCGSAVGEITSPELFQKVASRMGMATSLRAYKDPVEMVLLLDHAFRAGCHVIVFVQMDRDTSSRPASSDCQSQWLEHAIVVVGWSSGTLTTLKAKGDVSKVEYKTLFVTCFARSGGAEDISLSEIYNSSCQVVEQRKPERFYKHLTLDRHVPDRTVKDSWLGICDPCLKGGDSCYWHDFDFRYQHYLKLHREKYPDLHISCDLDALFDRAAAGLVPGIVTRESFSDNGSFRKKLVIVSLKTTDD